MTAVESEEEFDHVAAFRKTLLTNFNFQQDIFEIWRPSILEEHFSGECSAN